MDRDLQKHSTPYSRGKLLIAEKHTTRESQPPLNDTNNFPWNIYPHENTTTATDLKKHVKTRFEFYFAQIKILREELNTWFFICILHKSKYSLTEKVITRSLFVYSVSQSILF